VGFRLAQRHVWHNPARLLGPGGWGRDVQDSGGGADRPARPADGGDRLLLPRVDPAPRQAQEPASVVETARKVAEVWGPSLDEMAAATTNNARRLFRLLG